MRWLLAIALLVSCKRTKTEQVKAVPIEEAPKPLTDQELGAIACAGRAKCVLIKASRVNASLSVVEISTDADKSEDAELPHTPESCVPYEHWLVHQKGAAIDRKLLVGTCNDGYGASGVGEDSFTIEGATFRYTQSGGSASRWEHASVLELAPLRLRAIEWWSGWSIASAFERSSFDFVEFKGHTRWYRPSCPEGGGPPSDDSGMTDSATDVPTDGKPLYVYDPIVQVALPGDFDWKTTALDSCAPLFDGEKQGFVIHGGKGDRNDAAMRVLASGPKKLLIEVVDDVPISGSSSWLYDDHLEIWVQDEDTDPADLCLPTKAGGGAGRLRQWAIRISDGKLFPGFGAKAIATDPIVVERVGRRFSIELKMPVDRVSVVFSDSDDGKTQERLISTSKLEYGKAPTLGKIWAVPAAEAGCMVENGKLVRVLKRNFSGDAAALTDVP